MCCILLASLPTQNNAPFFFVKDVPDKEQIKMLA